MYRWKFSPAGYLCALLVAAAVAGGTLAAPQQPETPLSGTFDGAIGVLSFKLHLRIRPSGALTCTLDHLNPDQQPWMLTCADVHAAQRELSFAVPTIHAQWHGSLASDGSTLNGTWTQSGQSQIVNFHRVPFTPAQHPSAVDGIWLGTYPLPENKTGRAQLLVRSDSAGREYCTMDLPDIYTLDLECADVTLSGNHLDFDVPVGGIHWSGTLAPNGNSLDGKTTWEVIEGSATKVQEGSQSFSRQTAFVAENPPPALHYDPAIQPVSVDRMQDVLTADLKEALAAGPLAPSTGGGVSIGIYQHGVQRIFSFGAVRPDSIYEIGSITKTFTGLLLAQMVEQKQVQFDQPVRLLLPPGTVSAPAGSEITLLDLAAQRSGLPPMPDNISVANLEQPYADYHPADLYAYLRRNGVANSAHEVSDYGSLGFGLLGVALSDRAGRPYADLLKSEVTDPLKLTDTAANLTPDQAKRVAPGHDQFHGPAKMWDTDALAGALALHSTAGDMLTYLVANLHPDKLTNTTDSQNAAALPAAIRETLQVRGQLPSGMGIALGWLYQKETGNYWHNGATAAHSAYIFFNPEGDFAAVVLFNTSPGGNGSFAEVLGRHIYQRFTGKPAVSLAP